MWEKMSGSLVECTDNIKQFLEILKRRLVSWMLYSLLIKKQNIMQVKLEVRRLQIIRKDDKRKFDSKLFV